MACKFYIYIYMRSFEKNKIVWICRPVVWNVLSITLLKNWSCCRFVSFCGVLHQFQWSNLLCLTKGQLLLSNVDYLCLSPREQVLAALRVGFRLLLNSSNSAGEEWWTATEFNRSQIRSQIKRQLRDETFGMLLDTHNQIQLNSKSCGKSHYRLHWLGLDCNGTEGIPLLKQLWSVNL